MSNFSVRSIDKSPRKKEMASRIFSASCLEPLVNFNFGLLILKENIKKTLKLNHPLVERNLISFIISLFLKYINIFMYMNNTKGFHQENRYIILVKLI